jgi:hypothetical protein
MHTEASVEIDMTLITFAYDVGLSGGTIGLSKTTALRILDKAGQNP